VLVWLYAFRWQVVPDEPFRPQNHPFQGEIHDADHARRTPVASATPDGTVRVARRFRWIPDHELTRIELAERRHLESLIDRAEDFEEAEFRWQNQVQRLRNAADAGLEPYELELGRISSRQAVIRNVDGKDVNRRYGYSIGEAVRNGRSRSHELKKSRLRAARTVR